MRKGTPSAHLFAESAIYQFITDPDLTAPREWLKANVANVVSVYGEEHGLGKEDIVLGEA